MADIQILSPDGVSGTIPAEQLDAALKAGYSLPQPSAAAQAPADVVPQEVKDIQKPEDLSSDGRYNVVSPQGEKGSIPPEQIKAALLKGYQLQSVHNQQVAKEDNIHRWRTIFSSMLPDSVTTAITTGGDFFGAAQKAIDLAAKYGFDLKDEDIADMHTALQRMAEENPTASTIGSVGRFAGEMYIGGKAAGVAAPFAESATAGLEARPLLQTAAREGLTGIAAATPQALAQAVIDRDPKAAAESLLVGMGTGALIGSGIKRIAAAGAPEVAQALAPPVAETAGELSTYEKLLLEKLGLTPRMRMKIGDAEAQRNMLKLLASEFGEKELAQMGREELATKIEKLVDDNGPKIGGINKQLDEIVADKPELKVKTMPMGLKIAALGNDLVGKEEKAVVQQAIETLQEQQSELTFDEAKKLKTYFQGRAKYNAMDDSNVSKIKRAVAGVVREEIETAAQNAAVAGNNPKLIEDWTRYKQLYGLGSELEGAAGRVLNAPITHEFIPGGHGALGAGMMGHWIGSAVGTPIIGPFIGMAGSKLLKGYLREGGLTRLGYWLGQRIKSAEPGVHSLIAVDAVKSIGDRLQEIPAFVRGVAEAGAAKALVSSRTKAVSDSIKLALDEEANGLSKQEQFRRLADRISFMAANPQVAAQHFGDVVGGVAQNHPQLAADLSAAMQRKLEYLYHILPKNTQAPQPFQHDPDWKPSEAQLADFKKQLAVANDPFHVLDELKAGTLTAKQVATLAVINPDLLMKMRQELMKASMDKSAKLDYQKRLGMSILMGERMDQSLMSIPHLQQTYVQNGSAPPQNAGHTPRGKKPSLSTKDLPNYRTDFQQVMDKAGS